MLPAPGPRTARAVVLARPARKLAIAPLRTSRDVAPAGISPSEACPHNLRLAAPARVGSMKLSVRSNLAELQAELRRRGQPTHGTKVELLARLHTPPPSASASASPSSAAAPVVPAEASSSGALVPVAAAVVEPAQPAGGGLAAFLADSDGEADRPPPVPARKRLRRLASAEAPPPEPAVAARMGRPR